MNILNLSRADSQSKWASYANEFAELSNQFFSHISATAQEVLNFAQIEATHYQAQLQTTLQEVEVSQLIQGFNQSCTSIEKVFNIASCMLWVSGYSSPLRIMFGQAQALAGIALKVFSEIMLLASNTNEELDNDPELIEKWQQLSKFGSDLIVHGSLNTVRGTIELFINNITFSIGNLALVLPNILYGRNFAPLITYKDDGDVPIEAAKQIPPTFEACTAELVPMIFPEAVKVASNTSGSSHK